MDEDVIKALLDIPLWEVADLNQPSGAGDKKILREVSAISFVQFTFHVMPCNLRYRLL